MQDSCRSLFMKKLVALGVVCSVFLGGYAFSAVQRASRVPVQRPGVNVSTQPGITAQSESVSGVSSATTISSRGGGARSVRTPSTVNVNTASTPVKQGVSARAATQKAVNNGTKVAGATANVVVNGDCKTKYYGCMDSFCMLDNINGGRCLCSSRNAELDKIAEEIQKLDEQSYAMATSGVERIQMGDGADSVDAMVDDVTNSLNGTKKTKARSLNLDDWDDYYEEDDNVFSEFDDGIANLKGDALHSAVSDICLKQIPECSTNFSMLRMMYTQQIKSDCTAYENSLKQQKNASTRKLQTAQTAMREAALEQYQNANKYDLGQCTIRFKQCMQNTAGCGEDFSSCVSMSATANAQTKVGKKNKAATYTINTGITNITIAASTYDTLMAKKTICESVTKQCTDVKNKVWDAFLKDAAPELKSAELVAESNVRMNCISNISACFQKACKDNMDPNDPDGSYDLCLSRPQTMRSLCKIQIDQCVSAEPLILDYVYARLASMRVDACTKEVKSCLTDDNRCGKNYVNCIGLDTDTIINMCPSEKLTACNTDDKGKTLSQPDVYANIENIITGIMLNIDNSFLVQCQNAANEAMIKVCGDSENCDNLVVDSGAGKRSFKYEVCQYDELTANNIHWNGVCRDSLDGIAAQDLKLPEGMGWAGKLSGTIYWGNIEYQENPDGTFALTTPEQYIQKLIDGGHEVKNDEKQIIYERVYGGEINQLQNAINNAIKAIESDPKVQFCMTGRQVQGLSDRTFGRANAARFPNLTSQMRQTIVASAIKNARENYLKKYDEEIQRMMSDQVKAAQRIDADNALSVARQACSAWATSSGLPVQKTPKASNVGKYIAAGVIIAASVVAGIFTEGTATILGLKIAAGVLAATPGVIAGTTMLATMDTTIGKDGYEGVYSGESEAVGSHSTTQWNYEENVTTLFSASTGECTKITISKDCKKTKKNYCKEWGETKEKTTTMNLL